MKLYYPYFNLFRSVGTGVYSLETVVKIPSGKKIGKITQSFDGKVYNVTLPVEGGGEDKKENIVFERIKLTPSDEKELVVIKIHVDEKSESLETMNTKDPEPDNGAGNTGSNQSVDEMP